MTRPILHLRARDKDISLGHTTRIMGIINCTPDSFSGDGLYRNLSFPRKVLMPDTRSSCRTLAVARSCSRESRILHFAQKLIRDGADILDVGGESTRPGASSVSLKEEIRRVIPVVEVLARKIRVPISIDTSKMEVARSALDAGASIINNIKATQISASFLKMVRDYKAAIVVMHMRATPATMQVHAKYKDVMREVLAELKISVEKCLGVGIKKDRIIVDPGIGFAKTTDQSLMLIKHLNRLHVLHCPVLLGPSRKSFIGSILQKPPAGRLMGTAATVMAAAMQGAHIVRVHDVAAIKETLKVTDAILNVQP
jgi:dihydropteroate synthase